MLAEVAGGAGGVLVVEGPAGIGKSALIRAVRGRAADEGLTVLSARGAELEREFSFGVVRQLLEPALAGLSEHERRAVLSGAAGLAEPAIGQLDLGRPHEASPSADPTFAVLHGLYWLTSNLAEGGPILMAVDDAQWSDPASLRFLDYLAGRLEGLGVMIAAGVRTFEPGTADRVLDALRAEAGTHVIRPAPLSEAATDALVGSMLGAEPAPGFASACHRASGGNPQLIRELVAALVSEGAEPTPDRVAQVAELHADRIAKSVLARIERLGERAVAVAGAVAILGAEASIDAVSELAAIPRREAAEAFEGLAAIDVLVPGDEIAFVHPIVRSAVYGDLSAEASGEAHGRAARLLAQRGASLESVAAQLVASPPGGDAWAVVKLREAGEGAIARGAPEAAVTYLDRALTEDPEAPARAEILTGLGRALAMLREVRRCVKCLYEALDLTDEPRRRAEIVHLLITMLSISRSAGRGVELLDAELAALPPDAHDLGVRLESDIDSITFFSLGAKRAAEGRRRRFDDAQDPGLTASAAMVAALYEGPAARAAELARRAYGDGALLAREGPDAPPVWMVGWALLYSHRVREARAVADEWAREASHRGSLRAFSLASSLRTRALHWLGDLPEAEAEARAFVEGMPEAVGAGPAFLADVLAEQGRLDHAESALMRAQHADESVEWSFFYPMLLQSRGTLAVEHGRLDAAHEWLLKAARAAEEWGVATPGPFGWRVRLAEVLGRLGEAGEGRRLIEAELEACRHFGSPRASGIALRVAGLLEVGPQRIETLTEATAVLARSEARLERARALIDLGTALSRAQRTTDARAPLREGLAVARACGALPLAERAHEELRATGARPRKIVRTGADALTASERRVARMAASGMRNKEIAQSLFVTVRTVEAHLHHAYQKLNISSRAELPAELEGDEPHD